MFKELIYLTIVRDFISCLELISCIFFAVIKQDFKTYLAADYQF